MGGAVHRGSRGGAAEAPGSGRRGASAGPARREEGGGSSGASRVGRAARCRAWRAPCLPAWWTAAPGKSAGAEHLPRGRPLSPRPDPGCRAPHAGGGSPRSPGREAPRAEPAHLGREGCGAEAGPARSPPPPGGGCRPAALPAFSPLTVPAPPSPRVLPLCAPGARRGACGTFAAFPGVVTSVHHPGTDLALPGVEWLAQANELLPFRLENEKEKAPC